MTIIDLFSILPVIVLIVWALFLLLADLWLSKHKPGWTPILAVVGLLLSLAASVFQAGENFSGFGGFILVDGFSNFLQPFFAITGILAIGLAYDYLKRHRHPPRRVLHPAALQHQRHDADGVRRRFDHDLPVA